ncbi:hypothetical protein H2198_010946 [Neophaeococcomyces mojaviensis]|uniref:Uncharacterized protein n=1 Tax=Neophaeococcomyces mojaviensis TaxID=3383035 RepID=A0ACC2ZP32_9EURO|nr:hypothetical protein H2198_010946 [Knufia sp. JES_112]
MRDIEHLHLQICEECNHAGPDHDIYLEELRTFMPHLHEAWLNPYKNQLRSLSLSFLDGWGPLPGYFDGMHLQFPRMERLTLGNFMVAHNNALDWVLAQKSLKYLKLHKCRIVSHLRLDAAVLGDWDVRTHDWEALDAGEWDYPEDDKVFYYSGAWHQFFDRINEELPHLEDFEFISDVPERHIRGDWDNSTKLSAARYICFDEGLLPSRWIDPESFERQPDRHSETQDKDWVALENLRRTLERRRGSAGKKT